MFFSITGILYLLLSLGLGIFAYRVFIYWRQKSENLISKLFFYFFAIFTLIGFVLGLGGIFGKNPSLLGLMLFISYTLITLGCAILASLIFFIRFSRISHWLAFTPISILGISATVIAYFYGKPFITESGGINFGLPPLGYILMFFPYLFTFLPMSVILFQQTKDSKEPSLKNKTFLFALVALGGFILTFSEFIVEPFFNLEETSVNEVVLIILNLTLFIFLFFTRKNYSFAKIEGNI